ncbi:MAG TPA: cytochrome c [Vicinamibacterales bacterium]|jgi:mono/diheme cytochrome c family protein|nr:cytochrome c [Vicinamibacterales bacterium]
MDRRGFASVCLLLAGLGLTAQSTRTVWDGIYTEEQAARGEKLYTERCGKCHGDTLGGQEAAPALTGTAFYSNWEGEALEALFDRMRSTMPQDKPGSLSRAQNADILAHLLHVGGYPAGTMPLDGQSGALTTVTIRMYKP